MGPLLEQSRRPSSNGAYVASAPSARARSLWDPTSQSARTGARARGRAGPHLIRTGAGAGLAASPAIYVAQRSAGLNAGFVSLAALLSPSDLTTPRVPRGARAPGRPRRGLTFPRTETATLWPSTGRSGSGVSRRNEARQRRGPHLAGSKYKRGPTRTASADCGGLTWTSHSRPSGRSRSYWAHCPHAVGSSLRSRRHRG